MWAGGVVLSTQAQAPREPAPQFPLVAAEVEARADAAMRRGHERDGAWGAVPPVYRGVRRTF